MLQKPPAQYHTIKKEGSLAMPVGILQDILLGSATLSVVLAGLALITFVAFLPCVIYECLLLKWLWTSLLLQSANKASILLVRIGIILILLTMQCFHCYFLWTSTRYLALNRWLVLPIRKLVFPLVMFVARLESIREDTPTLYFDVHSEEEQRQQRCTKPSEQAQGQANAAAALVDDLIDDTRGPLRTPLLSPESNDQGHNRSEQRQHQPNLSKPDRIKKQREVRRRYQQMERTYRQAQIRHTWKWSETTLNLSQVVPVMWEHEQRICATTATPSASPAGATSSSPSLSATGTGGDNSNTSGGDKKGSVLEEFLLRFLVVTVVPNAILDYYYYVPSALSSSSMTMDPDGATRNDDTNASHSHERLGSIQLSVQQGHVLHWFMYFARDDVARAGIWFHGTGTARERARRIPTVKYCNGQVHQTQSKRNAGFFHVAHPSDKNQLQELYPWSFTFTPNSEDVDYELWPTDDTPVAEVSTPTNSQG